MLAGRVAFCMARFVHLLKMDTKPVELISSLWFLFFSVAMFISHTSMVKASNAYQSLLALYPSSLAWGIVMGIVGLMQFYAVFTCRDMLRRATAVPAMFLWLVTSTYTYIERGMIPSVWLVGMVGVSMCFAFVRAWRDD